tara:strand:+ start:622 stop:858 length:237 start_codon:yes stop_codon:yes gene_type:complete
MINELISMNGYGAYVWSAFIFTIINFAILYTIIKAQLVKEQRRFATKFNNLADIKIESAKQQQGIYKEILVNTSISKI